MKNAPRILVAPDSFKGTFSAEEVARAASAGVVEAGGRPDPCPVADGGEGTMTILVSALGGSTSRVTVHDPLYRSLDAQLGWIDGGTTAIVEAAQASGLALLTAAERDPERASTYGTGEMIVRAAAAGARRIIVTVGGSATSDGGAGALRAIARESSGLGGTQLIVLCDVNTTFENAALRYAPQKGADAAAVARLTERLHQQARALPRDPRGVPMTGAAGGLAGGLWAQLGAQLMPGAPWVLRAVAMQQRMARADAVVVGEGCLDDQSLEGKIVGEIASRCRAAGRPAHAIVGTSRLQADRAAEAGLASVRVASNLADIRAAGRAVALTVTCATIRPV